MGLTPDVEDAVAFAILAPFAEADAAIAEGLREAVLGGHVGQDAASELDRLSMRAVTWHGRTGIRGWLRAALWLSEQAWHSLPEDRPDAAAVTLAAVIQLHWGTNCLRYYQADHNQPKFLDAAVTRLAALAEALPDEHAVKPMALTNLSSALQERYREQPGRWGDLDESVRAGTRAVALSAMTDHLYASRVNNQGSALRARYQRDARIIDLRTAVEGQWSLLDAGMVPAEHRAMMMSNLSQALRELYEVTFDRALLREAARLHRVAVRLASRSSRPDRARILAAYGITTRLLHPTVRGARKAISFQQEALSLTPAGDVTRPSRTGSLAKSWQTLAEAERGGGALEAAEQAIIHFDEAIATTPDSAPNRTSWLLGRAETRELQWRQTREPDELRAALDGYAAALDAAAAQSPISTIDAALSGGRLARAAGHPGEALAFFSRGLAALEDLLPGQVTRGDQRSWQGHAEDLVAEACLAHAQAGSPEVALRVIDVYRARESALLAMAARIGGYAEDERGSQARQAIVDWLEVGGPAGDVPVDSVLAAILPDPGSTASTAASGRAAADLRSLIRPPGAAALSAATVEPVTHDVVYLVAASSGGVLLALRPDGIVKSAILPRLTAAAVRRQRSRVRKAYNARATAPREFDAALERHGRWAAEMIVRPLLRLTNPNGPLALIPTGPLAEIPLLAACYPAADGAKRFPLLGRPVTFGGSLTPARATGASATAGGARSPAAVTGDYPEHSTHALAEATAMGMCGAVTKVDGRSTAPEALLESIRDSELIHFSCHGIAARSDAAESLIELGWGNTLSVTQILRSAFTSQPLVFLASCSTAQPDQGLPDQTFGPPAAFRHAGARAVIAPTLAVSLLSAMLLSARFYHGLSRALSPDVALAEAQRWLAESSPEDRATFLDALASELVSLGRPADPVRGLRRALEHAHTTGKTEIRVCDWCFFTLNV
ncbi:MAG: CHAT domain-containing protein [Streptosporangiaceae bacterium]